MATPDITVEQVRQVLPQVTNIEYVDCCGQKVVFSGFIGKERYAIKFMLPSKTVIINDEEILLNDITARARREIETMEQCKCPYLVRMGPIGLSDCTIKEIKYIYYTEEFIDGQDLKSYLSANHLLNTDELITLAFQISIAIDEIWHHSKIHRDIKPSNIMRKSDAGDFVLLDMGLLFDLQEESLSNCPVGTQLYFSPEQMDFNNRRSVLNFRSDLFSLGIVMYEMTTGKHPFITDKTKSSWDVFANIQTHVPLEPGKIRSEIPKQLSDIIVRLLAKRPALRYRSINLFQQALSVVK